MQLLVNVVAHRNALRGHPTSRQQTTNASELKEMARNIGNGKLIVEEVANIIDLPDFDQRAIAANPEEVTLAPKVKTQCRAFVAKLAAIYNRNPFHNFEHATHVTMSVHKLLSRVVAPKVNDDTLANKYKSEEQLKHDLTYGITSDPLTQFAVVLSALIHDGMLFLFLCVTFFLFSIMYLTFWYALSLSLSVQLIIVVSLMEDWVKKTSVWLLCIRTNQ
jgi:hypothetical protein